MHKRFASAYTHPHTFVARYATYMHIHDTRGARYLIMCGRCGRLASLYLREVTLPLKVSESRWVRQREKERNQECGSEGVRE